MCRALSGFDPSSPNPADSSQAADKYNFLVGVEEEVIVLTGQKSTETHALKSYAPSPIKQGAYLSSNSKTFGVFYNPVRWKQKCQGCN